MPPYAKPTPSLTMPLSCVWKTSCAWRTHGLYASANLEPSDVASLLCASLSTASTVCRRSHCASASCRLGAGSSVRGATVYVPFLAMVTHPMGMSSKGRGVRGALAPTGTAPARLPPVALTEARALAEPKAPLRALMLPPLRALMLPPRALMLPPRALMEPLALVTALVTGSLALMHEAGEGARRGSAGAKTLRLLKGFSEAMLSDELSGAISPNGAGAVKLARGSRRGVGLHNAPASYVLSRVKQAGTISSSASGSAGGIRESYERAQIAFVSPLEL